MNNNKFYKQTWFIILMLILFFPVGLVLTWSSKKFKQRTKVIITGIIIVMAIIGAITPDTENSTTDVNNEIVQEDVKEEKVWKPKEIAELGKVYRNTENRNPDDSYLVINIRSVKKVDNTVVIQIAAPGKEELEYAFDKFMYVAALDEKGNTISTGDIKLNYIGRDGVECELIATNINDINKVEWVEVGPYKIEDGGVVTLKVE